jgi:hypothetical protein
MLFRSFAIASTVALSAQAFLLPPNTSDIDIDELEVSNIVSLSDRVVRVDCPGCYFQKKVADDQYVWVENVANSLVSGSGSCRWTLTTAFANSCPLRS